MELDEAVVRRMVGRALGDPSIGIVDWSARTLAGGMTQALGTSEGVLRVTGAGVSASRRTPWSIIIKTLRRVAEHDDPGDWDYWKREALAYRTGLLNDLPDGFAAPRCFGVEEVDDERVVIGLEDVRDAGPNPWPLDRYGLAARHLGRFNGANQTGGRPDWSWLSNGRIRQWLSQADRGFQEFDVLARSPIGSAWLTDESVARTKRAWRDRRPLLDALGRLPRCLCHHDAFRRNLIATRTEDGHDLTVAIDWAGVGMGVVGEDLATLVSISLQFLEVDAGDAAQLDRIAFEGYLAGLRDVGAVIDERTVRFGFAAAAHLLMGVGGTGGWLAWLVEEEDRPRVAEGIIGRPIDEILAQWRGLQPYLLDLGDEAHGLTSELGRIAR